MGTAMIGLGPRALGRVLVTGARGFVGAALVSDLRARAVDVVATDVSRADEIAGEVHLDVTDPDAVDALIRTRAFATIFHCGAVSGPMVMADRPREIWRINSAGTANVLDAAWRYGVSRVVVCSSTEIYGAGASPVDEETLPAPVSVYGASKVAAEQATLGYARGQGLDALCLRLSWIYGPGRRTPTTLDRLVRDAAAGRDAVLDMTADTRTHYLHIDDAVDGLLLAASVRTTKSLVHNITNGPAVPMSRIAKILMSECPGIRITFARPSKTALEGIPEIRNSRARNDLGFSPSIPLSLGLERLLQAVSKGVGKSDL